MLSPAQPLIYILVYIFLLYVRPHEFIPMLMGVPVMPISMLLATVMWLKQQGKRYEAVQFRLLGLQFFLMILSLLKTGRIDNAMVVIAEFAPVVLMFFIVASCITSLKQLRAIFAILGLIMAIIAVHSIDEADMGVGWTGAVPIVGRVTYMGFLSDPNDLSMAILMVLPMVLYLAVRAGWLMRVVWLVCAAGMLYNVMLCNSRGAVLAIGCMAMHFGIKRFGVRRALIVVPILIIPAILFGSDRMNQVSADEESAEGRVVAWEQGFLMFVANPLLGVGKGRFTDYHYLTAHNSYMLTLAELGSIGFIVWLSNIMMTILTAKMIDDVTEQKVPVPAAPKFGMLPVSKLTHTVESWADIKDASRVLWYGWTGGLSAMFFLSRSYIPILYLHIALMVAVFQMARRDNLLMPAIEWKTHRRKMILISLGAIVFLFLVTKKLRH